MQIYHILQAICFGYTGVSVLFICFMLFFEFKNKSTPYARHDMFRVINKLQGKSFILFIIQLFSLLFMISWLAITLPITDIITGLHFITRYVDDDGYAGINTWFGIFSDRGNAYLFYYLTSFVSVLGVYGFYSFTRMATILWSDTISVNYLGQWGPSNDFGK